MTNQLSSEIVWQELQKELFAVLGMVTSRGEARTTGVVYIVHERKVYILTGEDTWKARHVRQNQYVSITVPIAKRIPFLSVGENPCGDYLIFWKSQCAQC